MLIKQSLNFYFNFETRINAEPRNGLPLSFIGLLAEKTTIVGVNCIISGKIDANNF